MDYSYVNDFRKLGFGMFVHFGLYSVLGKGEWHFQYTRDSRMSDEVAMERYIEKTFPRFKVAPNWAKELCKTAKKAGCRYVTLTTRHHEGFSLYDTCGLNELDAPHSPTQRDLVQEFVDACREYDLLPVFYHTVIDWWQKDFRSGNFEAYFAYLKRSIEILCTRYGKVGGFWFDGTWGLPQGITFPEEIYQMIHALQPRAIITNNTGLSACGEKGGEEIDCVTFEKGKAFPISSSAARPIAGEVCDTIVEHWGYAKNDYCIKSYSHLLNELISTRAAGCNLLLNVGPKGNGFLPVEQKRMMEMLGSWLKKNHSIVLDATPSSVSTDGASLFEKDGFYYAVVQDVPMAADAHVQRDQGKKTVLLHTDKRISSLSMVDKPGEKIEKTSHQSFVITPFEYGTSMGARIAKFRLK